MMEQIQVSCVGFVVKRQFIYVLELQTSENTACNNLLKDHSQLSAR